MNSEQDKIITDLMEKQAAAIRKKDIAGATLNYAPDVLVFDVVGPLAQPKGIDSVKGRVEQWFSSFSNDGCIEFELVDVEILTNGDLAFSHSLNHVNGKLKNGGSLDMFWRETLNWEKRDGQWKIVHAHSSIPFDAATGKASTGLKPQVYVIG